MILFPFWVSEVENSEIDWVTCPQLTFGINISLLEECYFVLILPSCFYIFQGCPSDTGPGPTEIPDIFITPGVLACQVTHIFVSECIFLFP